MRNNNLHIAGYKISIESAEDGPELKPAIKFRNFLVEESPGEADLTLSVTSGSTNPPEEAIKVFGAPYIEENDGITLKRSDDFWNVYKCNKYIYIEVFFPHAPEGRKALLKLSKESMQWWLFTGKTIKEADPLEYPLDGLILYYLTALRGDILIHASGAVIEGKGFLFSGISGKGKTTMARLCDEAGAYVIHDDRLIIRKMPGGYRIYNTPVYRDDDPREAVLNTICLLEHGNKNAGYSVSGAEAVSRVMANCIQHGWDRALVADLLNSLTELCNVMPVLRLEFVPERGVIDYLREYEEEG